MGGIDFISSDKEDKKSKRKDFDSDVEYTSGEKLDAPHKEIEPPKDKPEKKKKSEKQKKEKESSFLHWRQERKKVEKNVERIHQAPKHKKEDQPDLLHAQTIKLEEQDKKNELDFSDPIKVTADEERAPDLLEDLKNQTKAPVKKPITTTKVEDQDKAPDLLADMTRPIPGLGEHGAPKHQKEYVETDLLEAVTKKYDIGEHVVKKKIGEDEAPDMLSVRSGKTSVKKRKKVGAASKSTRDGRSKGGRAPRSLGVNLIPDDALSELNSRSRLKDLGFTGIGIVAIILGIYAAMNVYQRKINLDTADLETQIEIVEAEIAEYNELQQTVKITNGQLEGIAEVLDKHIYWTPFLDVLEQLTLPTVYYTSMTGSATTGKFTFNAVATDFKQIEGQVGVLKRSDYVQSVSTSSASKYSAGSVVGEDTEAPAAEEQNAGLATDQAEEVAVVVEDETGEAVSTPATETELNADYVTFSLVVDFSPEVFNRINVSR